MLLRISTKISKEALEHSAIDLKNVAKDNHLQKLKPLIESALGHKETENGPNLVLETAICVISLGTLADVLDLLNHLRDTDPKVKTVIETLINVK